VRCRHVETLVSGDFRADFSKFRKMGSNKPLIVLRLLERHGLETVIISDVDTAWMRDPSEFLSRHPTADVLISTDCLSHWVEASFDPGDAKHAHFHRCGHLPGATFGRAFNTGVIIFRNRCDALLAIPGASASF
jgi:Nucleotide-diphospho-sugar transferase